MRDRNEHLTKKMGLQPAIDDLAKHSSKVSTSGEYLEHVQARLRTMDLMRTRMKAKAPRRWAFDCYHLEQLAARKLSKDLVSGCGTNVLIVWGNGGFGPTSRGHAAAPNKRLRLLLSKYVPVVLSSEYWSSQRSACCHAKLDDRPSQKKRVTVKQCKDCGTLLSRDLSAACIILDIFNHQRMYQTDSLPAFINS